MTGTARNVAASVHARLLNLARATRDEHQSLVQRYAGERFLFRLGQSAHRERFVLKGAMLFRLWGSSAYRPTRDLDFSCYGESDIPAVIACIRDICAAEVEDDGIVFDLTALTVAPIREEAEYGGLRITFDAHLGAARLPMQLDLGFGNAIQPGPTDERYPTILEDSASPNVRAYPQEAVVAEKLHALVILGERTTRMKDLYDLYVFSIQFPFDGARLGKAITATFERRRTEIVAAVPGGLVPRFFADGVRAERWRAYVTKNRLPGAPTDLAAVGEQLIRFLVPVWTILASGQLFDGTWSLGGPWAVTPAVEEPRA